MLKLYNTLTRKKQVFKPLKRGYVGFYACGPTVYQYAHIGNLRTYIFEDILRRTLEFNGYKVKHVMNITDVGHLTSDADAGEDKIEREAKKEKKSVIEIAKFYTKAFLRDIKALNINKPSVLAPATKYIPQQIAIIKRLVAKGYAYETSAAVYFDVSKFKDYYKLSGQPAGKKLIGARKEVVVDPDKKDPIDFALWFKLVGRFKNHILRWPSPWGMGFPGWHIECSAISTANLGQPFDIHAGGIDHIPVHHTNEIAQSEAAFGKPLARYWLHGEFLIMGKLKMAKSKGNFMTLEDLVKLGFDPLAFRYLALNTHYRSKLNFTLEGLKAAQNALNNLKRFLAYPENSSLDKRDKENNSLSLYEKKFFEAVNDDLNTPRALSVVWKLIGDRTVSWKAKRALILKFDEVLGLGLNKIKPIKIPAKIKELAKKREKLRQEKKWAEADSIRKEIEKMGWIIEDSREGTIIKKSKFQNPNVK